MVSGRNCARWVDHITKYIRINTDHIQHIHNTSELQHRERFHCASNDAKHVDSKSSPFKYRESFFKKTLLITIMVYLVEDYY
jgi:UDP-N-acetylenolpyruvoylglucosamine reductase